MVHTARMLRSRLFLVGLLSLSSTACIIVQDRDQQGARPQFVDQPPATRPAPAPNARSPRPAPTPQVRPDRAPEPPPQQRPAIAANPVLATTTARLFVSVIGGTCALSVDGIDRGVGAGLNEPVSLGDHEVVCVADRNRMSKRFTVRDLSPVRIEFQVAQPTAPAALTVPGSPVDPRTIPLPVPATR